VSKCVETISSPEADPAQLYSLRSGIEIVMVKDKRTLPVGLRDGIGGVLDSADISLVVGLLSAMHVPRRFIWLR